MAADAKTYRQEGPCLTCGAAMRYGRARLGKVLDRAIEKMGQFQRPFRFVYYPGPAQASEESSAQQHEVAVRLGYYPEPSVHTIDGVYYSYPVKFCLCAGCLKEIAAGLDAITATERIRRAAENERLEYERRWRRPQLGEFQPHCGSAKYLLVAPSLAFWELRFSWRTSTIRCRGSSPALLVAFSVSGHLAGRLLWECSPCQSCKTVRVCCQAKTARDANAYLLRLWLQNNLQPELQRIEPDYVWDAESVDSLYMGQADIVLTVCKGMRFAAIANCQSMKDLKLLLGRIDYNLIQPGESHA